MKMTIDWDTECQCCEHYKPYKCGKQSDGTDNIVFVCELEACKHDRT